jgi:hypothetical protein
MSAPNFFSAYFFVHSAQEQFLRAGSGVRRRPLNTPYDALTVVAEYRAFRWRITGLTAIVEHQFNRDLRGKSCERSYIWR